MNIRTTQQSHDNNNILQYNDKLIMCTIFFSVPDLIQIKHNAEKLVVTIKEIQLLLAMYVCNIRKTVNRRIYNIIMFQQCHDVYSSCQ